MYNMMVVDDERFAVQGISRAIDWSDLPIGEVLEAYSPREASELSAAHRIHVLIVDIEMPDADGFQVLETVRAHNPEAEAIFLTAHANFQYAQRALEQGSFSYILKPFDHLSLKEVVRKALEKIGEVEEMAEAFEQYRQYSSMWEKQRPVLVERFWQDLLQGRTVPSDGYLEYAAALYQLPVRADDPIVPVLISLESWNKELTSREEAILEFALGNIAGELLSEWGKGDIVKVPGGHVALIQAAEGKGRQAVAVRQLCERLIDACRQYLQCTLTCYVGEVVPTRKLPHAFGRLLEKERLNVNTANTVIFPDQDSGLQLNAAMFRWPDLRILLDMGKRRELDGKLKQLFRDMEEDPITAETLESFYFYLLHHIYQLLHERGIPVHEVYSTKDLMDGSSVTSSLNRMKNWADLMIDKAMKALDESGSSHSAIVERVCSYVRAHAADTISRDDLATAVHLNPAYLSRLFKKEKGISLSDYMMTEKMNRAKELLISTNLKVSAVAEQVGYGHYTYFSRLFRKLTGVTPQEYRKSYQIL